eukprot:TRINITY_DN22377_c0_g1_i1.p1 TRINITY_DN22377_c0_g1~~TRINITY_DN22377_c0_g1_i1.p1  ORF type:complete len:657 (-),score=173.64 TRINITY_DN22377_c0_g1_i1:8-1909(-)
MTGREEDTDLKWGIDEEHHGLAAGDGCHEDNQSCKHLIKAFPMGVYIWSLRSSKDPLQWILKYGNHVAEKFTGLKTSLVVSKTIREVFPDEQIHQHMHKVLSSGAELSLGEVSYGDFRVAKRTYLTKIVPLSRHTVGVLFEDVSNEAETVERRRVDKAQLDYFLDQLVVVLISTSYGHLRPEMSPKLNLLKFLINFADSTWNTHVTWDLGNPKKPAVEVADSSYLVRKLTAVEKSDDGFMVDFFSTYRTFMTAQMLFKKLIFRYVSVPPKEDKDAIQKRVRCVLKYWIENHFSDFQVDPELIIFLQNFLVHCVSVSNSGSRWNVKINKILTSHYEPKVFKSPLNCPVLFSSEMKSKIFDLNPGIVANQLTLIAFHWFQKIEISELENSSWTLETRKATSPNVTASITHFNRVSGWMTTELVSSTSLKRRLQILKFFISIGYATYLYKDYETMFAVVLALEQYPVTRLTDLWRNLDPQSREEWSKIREIFDHTHNYKRYRAEFGRQLSNNKNVIPYLGLILKDLTFVQDGNSNFDADGRVNFYKMRMISSMFKDMKKCQQSNFNFKKDIEVLSFLKFGMRIRDEEEIWTLSQRCQDKAESLTRGRSLTSLSGIFRNSEAPEPIVTAFDNPMYGK